MSFPKTQTINFPTFNSQPQTHPLFIVHVSASPTPFEIMASSSEHSPASSNRDIDLVHIGAWCSLPPQGEYFASLQLFNASITPTPHDSHLSTCSSTSVKNAKPKLKHASITSEAGRQLAHAVTLRESILERLTVNSQQVSNYCAIGTSGYIEDNKTQYVLKSENRSSGYDYGNTVHSPMVQEWLGEGYEEEVFAPTKRAQEAAAGIEYDRAGTRDSRLQPATNNETNLNHN
jgi:hypothetical protein